jgi:tetratricopeptide (TPR) repeat protein
VAITDPSKCITCGFFAYALYVNCGLYLLEENYLQDAKELLEVACAIAPWSDSAFANLGRTLEALGDLEGGLSHYKNAVNLAPGVPLYQKSVERLEAKLGIG